MALFMDALFLNGNRYFRLWLFLAVCFLATINYNSVAQQQKPLLTGIVIDAETKLPVFNVVVKRAGSEKQVTTLADGRFFLSGVKGSQELSFTHPDYQAISISNFHVDPFAPNNFRIMLVPAPGAEKKDSLQNNAAVRPKDYLNLITGAAYNKKNIFPDASYILNVENIHPGNYYTTPIALSGLAGVTILEDPRNWNQEGINVNGFGEQYNDVLLNGTTLPFSDPGARKFALSLLPVEALDNVSVSTGADLSGRSDFLGGQVKITTSSMPAGDFFFVRAGTTISEHTTGKTFLNESRGQYEYLGFPGRKRALPVSFPNATSEFLLNDKNQQEQVFLTKLLPNNISTKTQDALPDSKLVIGFGRNRLFKNKLRIGVNGFVQHSHSSRIDDAQVQVAPDLAFNPYPFKVAVGLIQGQATDRTYNYSSALSGVANFSVAFGNNKIALRNFGAVTFQNQFTNRQNVLKPDEDSLAHGALRFFTDQQVFWSSVLSGEHALGVNHRLMLNWTAGYSYLSHQNPDERNLLLRQSSVDVTKFQLAAPQSDLPSVDGAFTNSSRQWRAYKEHGFTGNMNLIFPFQLFGKVQQLSGGIYLESRYRITQQDLLLIKGSGFVSNTELLAPERYFPGGVTSTNYYLHPKYVGGAIQALTAREKGNYSASATTGASYLDLQLQILKKLELVGGARLQSISQLLSNIDFKYFNGFQNPQVTTINENVNVQRLMVLPAVKLVFKPLTSIRVEAAYFETYLTPQLQELSDSRYYDAQTFTVKMGNSLLKPTKVRNTVLSLFYLPTADLSVHASGSLKMIDEATEYFVSSYNSANRIMMPFNVPYSEIYGVEAGVDYKFRIAAPGAAFSTLGVMLNGAYNQSAVDEGPVKNLSSIYPRHDLAGVSKYVMNGTITLQGYKLPELCVQYSRTDDYILAQGTGVLRQLGNGKSANDIPAIRMRGNNNFNFQVAQTLFKHKVQVIAGINNVFAEDYIQYQDLNGNKKFDTILKVDPNGNKAALYVSGTDNAVLRVRGQRGYFLAISYLMR